MSQKIFQLRIHNYTSTGGAGCPPINLLSLGRRVHARFTCGINALLVVIRPICCRFEEFALNQPFHMKGCGRRGGGPASWHRCFASFYRINVQPHTLNPLFFLFILLKLLPVAFIDAYSVAFGEPTYALRVCHSAPGSVIFTEYSTSCPSQQKMQQRELAGEPVVLRVYDITRGM